MGNGHLKGIEEHQSLNNNQVGFFHQEILGVVLLPLYYPLIGLHVKLYNIIGSLRHCIGQGGAVKCCSIND